MDNQIHFLMGLGKKLEYKKMEDWYQISEKDIEKLGGDTYLVQYYSNSIKNALLSNYPEHKWTFVEMEERWNQKNLRIFMERLAIQLNLKEIDSDLANKIYRKSHTD